VPLFYRKEQGHNARIVVEGLLRGLERKTAEPIAREHGVPRKPIQFFVGSGKWDDEAVMAELRHHVVETRGDPQGVVVFDPSAFPKKGTHSCGVAREWCGRLGKVENGQIGLFMAYATGRGQGPLDRRLYLSQEWAADRVRRDECHVPAGVKFQERGRMALEMLDCHRDSVPHGAVAAEDEFGRVAAFPGRSAGSPGSLRAGGALQYAGAGPARASAAATSGPEEPSAPSGISTGGPMGRRPTGGSLARVPRAGRPEGSDPSPSRYDPGADPSRQPIGTRRGVDCDSSFGV